MSVARVAFLVFLFVPSACRPRAHSDTRAGQSVVDGVKDSGAGQEGTEARRHEGTEEGRSGDDPTDSSVPDVSTTGVADVEPAPAETPEEDWSDINGIETFRRWFLIRRDAMAVGTCVLRIRTFQDGALTRTGLEYRVFRGEKEYPWEFAWFKGFSSEFTTGGALAEWANGREGKFGMNYRLQGAGSGAATFRGNLFDVGHRNPRSIKLPAGYKLLQALGGRLREAFGGTMKPTFVWKRYIWREWEPTWHDFRYSYEGPETVSSIDGSPVAAYRFKVVREGGKDAGTEGEKKARRHEGTEGRRDEWTETLWVDERGYPVRRVIAIDGGARWEMILSEEEPGDTARFVSWKAACLEYEGEARAFLRSIGVWY